MWLVKTYHRHSENAFVLPLWCLHHKPMSDAELFSSEMVCDWSCKLRHAKVSATGKSTWKVCSVSASPTDMLIETKGYERSIRPKLQSVDESLHMALAERKTAFTGHVWLDLPSRNEQTISNNCSNRMQWQSLVSRFPNDLFLKNEESASCWPAILP